MLSGGQYPALNQERFKEFAATLWEQNQPLFEDYHHYLARFPQLAGELNVFYVDRAAGRIDFVGLAFPKVRVVQTTPLS
jgi:hypothetical protein